MTKKYCLSLTGAGTYKQEMLLAAREYLECNDWDLVNRQIMDENLLQLNSVANRKRIGSEMIKRLKTLSRKELEFFANAKGDDLSAMTWMIFCRTYPIMEAFSKKLVVDRYQKMRPDISKEIYEAFIDDEMYEHPELEAITDASRDKIKIRIFGMARDCKIIDSNSVITPLYPSPAFVNLLKETSKEDLSLFPKVGVLL